MTAGRNTLAEAIEAWRGLSNEQREDFINGAIYVDSGSIDANVLAIGEAILRAAAEPEAKAPICHHGEPAMRMVPSRDGGGAWKCEHCGARSYDPKNLSDAVPR